MGLGLMGARLETGPDHGTGMGASQPLRALIPGQMGLPYLLSGHCKGTWLATLPSGKRKGGVGVEPRVSRT